MGTNFYFRDGRELGNKNLTELKKIKSAKGEMEYVEPNLHKRTSLSDHLYHIGRYSAGGEFLLAVPLEFLKGLNWNVQVEQVGYVPNINNIEQLLALLESDQVSKITTRSIGDNFC